jgi:parvulin-like peptidyl-prolyl isomerase
MESQQFLVVDNYPISLAQAMRYLQASGRMQLLIGDILRQYIIEKELQARTDIEVNSALSEQAIIDFRLQNQLTDAKKFQDWLINQGTDRESFHRQISFGFKLDKLKVLITEPKLQEYFIERKLFLDRVVISRIIVEQQELAEELGSQFEEGASFEQLAKEYSVADDRIVNGMMGPISRGTLPDELRAAIDMASPGEVVGPLAIDGRWGLFRVEQFLPASLEQIQLKQALQNELFEQWLAEKIQKLTVKLQVS